MGHQFCASKLAQEIGEQVGPSMLFSTLGPSPTQVWNILHLGPVDFCIAWCCCVVVADAVEISGHLLGPLWMDCRTTSRCLLENKSDSISLLLCLASQGNIASPQLIAHTSNIVGLNFASEILVLHPGCHSWPPDVHSVNCGYIRFDEVGQ